MCNASWLRRHRDDDGREGEAEDDSHTQERDEEPEQADKVTETSMHGECKVRNKLVTLWRPPSQLSSHIKYDTMLEISLPRTKFIILL